MPRAVPTSPRGAFVRTGPNMVDPDRRPASISIRWYLILVVAVAWCSAFAAAHWDVYQDRRNYQLWRIPWAVLESLRLK